jgi:hypothetical protein
MRSHLPVEEENTEMTFRSCSEIRDLSGVGQEWRVGIGLGEGKSDHIVSFVEGWREYCEPINDKMTIMNESKEPIRLWITVPRCCRFQVCPISPQNETLDPKSEMMILFTIAPVDLLNFIMNCFSLKLVNLKISKLQLMKLFPFQKRQSQFHDVTLTFLRCIE